jgi:hypothetical protein
MRPVKSLDTFDGLTKSFHPDGLYSTETFGIVGSDARDSRYGYIDLKISVIHPIIFNTITSLKSLYKDIMASKAFAVWDPAISDFVKSDIVDGQTGYEFFMTHFHKLVFEEKDSVRRDQSLKLFEKYKEDCLITKVLVIPAGLRDLEIDDFGRPSSDEINTLYYKLIAISNTINPATVKVSPEAYNSQRMSLQNGLNEVYEYIAAIVEGKKNLMMGKWASRKVFNGTRNVITSMNTVSPLLGDESNVGFNDTSIGLYQTLKGILPISLFHLKNGFLSTVFTSVNSDALLTNKKTLMSERVQLKNEDYSNWMTNEGLEKFITYFKEDSIRHNPIYVDNYYLGLMYKGPDGTFKLIHGIDELPEGRKKEDCTPITIAELLYTAIYNVANNYPVFITRYPIASSRSIYPSKTYLRTTMKSEVRVELDDDWKPNPEKVAGQFPTKTNFFNSVSPHSSRLQKLGADFDGDTTSATFTYADESVKEINDYFLTKAAYVGSDGKFVYDTNTDTISRVIFNMTSDVKVS